MHNAQERRSHERNLNIKDLDRFDDLEWEEEMFDHSRKNTPRHQQPINLTSKIEDYFSQLNRRGE